MSPTRKTPDSAVSCSAPTVPSTSSLTRCNRRYPQPIAGNGRRAAANGYGQRVSGPLSEDDPDYADRRRKQQRQSDRQATLGRRVCRVDLLCCRLQRKVSNTFRGRRRSEEADYYQDGAAKRKQQRREVKEVDGSKPQPE